MITVNEPIYQQVFWVGQVSLEIVVPQAVAQTVPAIGTHWYFIGSVADGYAPFDVNGIRCIGFTGTGSASSSEEPWFSFVITEPSSVTFAYQLPDPENEFSWTAPQEIASNVKGDVVAIARKKIDGSPVVIFHDPIAGTLESTYYLSGVWYSTTIDTVGSANMSVSLVLDSDDIPHVIYFDGITRYLKYAFFDSNFWRTRTLDPVIGSGRYNSLAIDRFGNLYATYYNLQNGNLYMAKSGNAGKTSSKGESWAIELVDDSGNVGMYCSIAVSPLWGEPHIAYYDSTNGELKYAFKANGSQAWEVSNVPYNGDLGMNASIVVDPSGRPAIACQENTVETNSQGLVFAVLRDSGWQITDLDSVDVTGFYPSLRIDSSGNYHIAYHNFTNLFYARFNGITWSVNQLTDGADIGNDTGLALDNSSNPAIVYWDAGDLKYSNATSGAFTGNIVNHYLYSGDEEPQAQPDVDVSTGGGGGCFIATAAFSAYSSSIVQTLTSFRDSSLNASLQGSQLVKLYYSCSPIIATEMTSSVKAIVRELID